MESNVKTEEELKDFASAHRIPFTVDQTNEGIARDTMRRAVVSMQLRHSVPLIRVSHSDTVSIQWESMSCYLDAIVFILVQKHPALDRCLWETLTHRPHSVPPLCNHSVQRVRETWRQTLFRIFESKRVSMRPFLGTLKECEDMISDQTPFWTSCLNDPLEFLQNVWIPILMHRPETSLVGPFHSRTTYETDPEHATVEPEVVREKKETDSITLQILSLSREELDGGMWFSEDTRIIESRNDYSDTSVYKTKDTWEYTETTKEFIQHKGTEEERRVKEEDRTDAIGSRILSTRTHTTPFHPNANVILMGIQSDDGLDVMIPSRIHKKKTYECVGAVLYSNRHYTALHHDSSTQKWTLYDSMKKEPVILSEEDAETRMKDHVRMVCFVGLQD